MSRIIGVLSGKGGVGKTSIVANLGASLTADFGKNAVILDANLRSSHLGMHIGVYDDLPVTLKDVLSKNKPVSKAVHIHSTGVKIVPASMDGGMFEASPSRMRSVARSLAQDYELVVMDCPPGLGKEVVTAASAIDSGLIVTTPDLPAASAALKTVALLERMDKDVSGIVVNRRGSKRHELTEREIESTCGSRVVATIPDDAQVPEGISMGVPAVLLSPDSKASVALKRLAGSLVGSQYSAGPFYKKVLGILSPRKVGVGRKAHLEGMASRMLAKK